jgi:S1-C subfamily serine protease
MHKLFVLLAFSLFIANCSSVKQVKYPEKTAIIDHANRSTVALIATMNGKTHPYCSGVWISQNHILTASHCAEKFAEHLSTADKTVSPLGLAVEYATQDEVVGVEQEPLVKHNATVIKLDMPNDLGLIETVGAVPAHEVVVLAKTTPAIGSTVYATGHPVGLYFTPTSGMVSAYRNQLPYDDRKLHYVQLSMPLWNGYSGCGIFNEKGELVAIAEAVSKNVPLASFGVPLDIINGFLNPTK